MQPATAFLIISSAATGALAQTIATCDGNQQPDWDDCAKIQAPFDQQPGHFQNFYPGCSVLNAPEGVDSKTLNCQIEICPTSAEQSLSYSSESVGYTVLDTDCKPADAGGLYTYESEKWTMKISNNPDYDPPVKHRSVESSKRSHPRDFTAKRQQPGDNGWTLGIREDHVERPGSEKPVTGRLPARSTYTTTHENSQTTGVETSAEAGVDFFEIFSASVSITTSYDTTTSSTEGVNVYVDCDDGEEGMIYWYPLFTAYRGYYTPSKNEGDWFIPEDSPESGTNYRVHCLS